VKTYLYQYDDDAMFVALAVLDVVAAFMGLHGYKLEIGF
jgi:hypothetical protein